MRVSFLLVVRSFDFGLDTAGSISCRLSSATKDDPADVKFDFFEGFDYYEYIEDYDQGTVVTVIDH